MRVKLIIALAIASILLVGSLPAGAIFTPGPNGVVINVPTPVNVPITGLAPVVPCVSFLATPAPQVTTFGTVGPLALGTPSLAATISLSGPPVPGLIPPSFVLSQLAPPTITPFIANAPILFDPVR